MNNSEKVLTAERPRSGFFYRLVQLWTAIITIGVTEYQLDWEKKRTRLLNGICAMSAIIISIYCLMYLDDKHRLTFWESFIGMTASAIPIFINSFKKHNAACHFFCIYNLLSYTFQAISHGYVDAAEYILIPSSLASMLFFKNTKIIVTYFLLNGICFAICKYSFTVMKPFLFMPDGENLFVGNHIVVFIIIFLIVYYFRSENARQEGLLETKNIRLAEEKQKSDELLLNILPSETAEELKATGTAKAKDFNNVTVLFTDFKNFTAMSEQLTAQELVNEINYCYSAFDTIISKYDIEKIKTIGDSYMCAGGLPVSNTTHPQDTVMAALEIRDFMLNERQKRMAQGKTFFEIRIGLHTGPVVAGIVGIKKYSYDIWGDTVNIASRMESSSEPGKVNISGSTYELVKDKFASSGSSSHLLPGEKENGKIIFIHRGKIEAKNKGEIDMYFVEKLLS